MLTECMQVLPSALWASRRSWKGVLLYNSSQPRSGQKSPLTVVVVTKHSPSLYSRLHPKSATVIQQPTKLRGGRSPLTVVVVTKHFSFYTVHRWYTEIGEGFWVCSGLLPHSTLSLYSRPRPIHCSVLHYCSCAAVWWGDNKERVHSFCMERQWIGRGRE